MRALESEPTDYELSPAAEILARRFIQRWDMYPHQVANGGLYVTVHEPLTVAHLLAHLRGELTLGTYLLNPQSLGRFLVFDADTLHQWQQLLSLYQTLQEMDTVGYLERSRRGGHLWLFLAEWQPGEYIRLFGKRLLATQGMAEMELYPKQDRLEGGPGSLIRLPFGIHRKNGRRYGFVQPTGEPLAPSLRDQVALFSRPQTVPKAVFATLAKNIPTPPQQNRFSTIPAAQKGVCEVAETAVLSVRIKGAISVRDFVGRYVALSEKGLGLCPFHDDLHPSFSVNDEGNYWHCFACNIGGSIIDFWMRKQDCDFTTALSELAQQLL